MVSVRDIYNHIDELAPFKTALSFDNAGLLVGDCDAEVNKVLLTLDITKEVVYEAKEKGVQLIVSHHPIIFNPMKNFSFNSVVHFLSKFEINAICAHTNLDVAEQGVNFHLAKALNMQSLTALTIEENQPMGLFGNLENEMPGKEFACFVKNKLNCSGLRFTQTGKKIKKVAVCSGSGGGFVHKAADMGADAFVTGEIKHSQILAANDSGLMVVDVGHYRSENIIIEPLKLELENNFKDVEFLISKKFSDKIEYL